MKNSSIDRLSFLLATLAISVGCTRSEVPEGHGLIQIVTPPRSALESKMTKQGLALPAYLKPCYGVNVTGDGIADTRENACSPAVGFTGGTVGAGERLSVAVPKGNNRSIELHVVLVQNDEACPNLNAALLGQSQNRSRTFRSGATSGVSVTGDTQDVEVTLAFPGVLNDLEASANSVCLPQPALRATVASNGEFFAPNGDSIPGSPVVDSIYSIPLVSAGSNGFLTATGFLGNSTQGFTVVPPYLYSVTRKPDLGTYFALDQENQIHQIDPIFANLANVTKLTSANCPFAVNDCKAPAWIHSISAGYGRSLYGTDVEGRVYALGAGAPSPLAVYIPGYMQGFVYY